MPNRGRHKVTNKHLIVRILGQAIANRMMEYQKKQGNPPNLDIFINHPKAAASGEGFTWERTEEGFSYWARITDNIETYLNNHGIRYIS